MSKLTLQRIIQMKINPAFVFNREESTPLKYKLRKGIILLFSFAFLINCSNDDDFTEDPKDPDIALTTVVFEQPFITNIENYINIDPNNSDYFKYNQLMMVSHVLHRYVGDHYAYSVTNWDIGEYTGVPSTPPFKNSQRSISLGNANKGGTAFQVSGNSIGAINAPHLFPKILEKIPGTLIFPVHPLEFVFSSNKRVRPFVNNGNSINMSFKLKLPYAENYDTNGIAYVGPNFTIRDMVSGTIFYIGTQLWDSRGVGHEGLMVDDCDKCSGNVMVPTVLSNKSKYITPMDNTAYFRDYTWDNFQYFGWSLTRENFNNIISEIKSNYPEKNLSSNLDTYEVVSFLMGTEVVLPSLSDKYSVAVAIKDFKITITH